MNRSVCFPLMRIEVVYMLLMEGEENIQTQPVASGGLPRNFTKKDKLLLLLTSPRIFHTSFKVNQEVGTCFRTLIASDGKHSNLS